MNFLKPKIWERKNFVSSILLRPISLLIELFIILKKKFTNIKKFNIPIICVGNIYIGGTGKTPLSILIANELKKRNKKTVIVKKYYQDQEDEHRLICEKTDELILNKSRAKAIKEAEANNFDVAILDDGFQDYSIEKKINILCFNSKQLIGNGLIIPSGPLRENMNALKKTKIVVINGEKSENFEQKILDISDNIKIFYSKYLPSNISKFKNKKLFAFAGIGNPQNFFELLIENNLNVQKFKAYPDHYKFERSEIQAIIDDAKKENLEIITTEKDYYRIKHLGFMNLNFLIINLEIMEKEKFLNQISKNL